MIGSPVDLSFKGMTISALDRRQFVRMRDLTDVCMTGSAEVLAMDRMSILLRSDLVMAGKAIFVTDFLWGTQGARGKDRYSYQAKKKNREYFQRNNPQEETGQRPS
jgi:hypothetical protein